MKNQTSVEWLIDQYVNQNYGIEIGDQAKEMEKNQIMDAHRHGFTEGTCFGATTIYKFISAEQYYNETFNLEK